MPRRTADHRFPDVPDLTARLFDLLAQVPRGRVATCGDLADALGDRVASRWVGHVALHHDHQRDCRCHRIVRAGGALGGYAAGSSREKIEMLRSEGIDVQDERVDLERHGFKEFESDRPLKRLRESQEAMRSRIRICPRRGLPKLIGGVDVAYPRPGIGSAAYALVERDSGQLVWSAVVRRPGVFPYISSYLSFREIPILLELLDKVRAAGRLAEVLLVDGTGILHPRRAGIASHLGVAAGLPTVGVIKKLLCGRVNLDGMAPGQSRPVHDDHRLLGFALRPTVGKPIFISPGHRTNAAFAEQAARQTLAGRRLPAPIDWADRLSRDHP